MSNYLCLVTNEKIKNLNCIYGTFLKSIDIDETIFHELNNKVLYGYLLETDVNYEKLKEVKLVVPELYNESERLLNSVYALVDSLLSANKIVAIFLSYDNRVFSDVYWRSVSVSLEMLKAENVEFDFDTIYLLQKIENEN